MPVIKFTARSVARLKPPKSGQIDYWDASLPGFGLRLSYGGRVSWQIGYRMPNDGKNRKQKFTLGTYPNLSLAEACERAKALFRDIEAGINPRDRRETERRAETFAHLADLYLTLYARPRKRSWREDERLVRRELIPAFGSLKAHEVTRSDILRLIRGIAERGAPIQANRALSLVHKIFAWAISEDHISIEANPAANIKKPGVETRRQHSLNAEELQTLWAALDDQKGGMSPGGRLVLKFILVTAQRPGEVAGMRWKDLDPDWQDSPVPVWHIPAERYKNKRPHMVPLSSLSVSILKQAKETAGDSEYVFPSPRAGQPLQVNGLSHALRRSRHFGLPPFRPHDLRRTASTQMTGEHCGITPFIRDRVLGHVDQSVAGKHYDVNTYLPEKRHALNVWAARLDDIVAGRKSNVVALRG